MIVKDIDVLARRRMSDLAASISIVNERLKKAPEGQIAKRFRKDKGFFQFYLRTKGAGKNGQYISSKEKTKIANYLQKKYDQDAQVLLQDEIDCLRNFLDAYENVAGKSDELYAGLHDQIKEMVMPVCMTDQEYVKAWMEKKSVKRKISFSTNDSFVTEAGETVRSKSELNIANMLYKYKIPYKSEYPLELKNGTIIYPDFTTLDVKNRKEIYWEHRGVMDDLDYSRKAVDKMYSYQENDIFWGINMIVTEETRTKQLGTKEVKKIIETFFGISL